MLNPPLKVLLVRHAQSMNNIVQAGVQQKIKAGVPPAQAQVYGTVLLRVHTKSEHTHQSRTARGLGVLRSCADMCVEIPAHFPFKMCLWKFPTGQSFLENREKSQGIREHDTLRILETLQAEWLQNRHDDPDLSPDGYGQLPFLGLHVKGLKINVSDVCGACCWDVPWACGSISQYLGGGAVCLGCFECVCVDPCQQSTARLHEHTEEMDPFPVAYSHMALVLFDTFVLLR
jgi:hypothetical protein